MPTKAELQAKLQEVENRLVRVLSEPVANGDLPDFDSMIISERIWWIREQRAVIIKKATGSDAGFDSAVAHTDLVRAVRPLFQTAKVLWFPLKVFTEGSQQVEFGHGIGLWSMHHWVYRFQSVGDPNDFMDIEVVSTGWSNKFDGFDKGPGKASTYADKYALLRILGLESGDMDDPDFTPAPPETGDVTDPTTQKIIEIRGLLKTESELTDGLGAKQAESQCIAAIARKHSRPNIKNIFGLPEELLDEWLVALKARA